MRLSRTNLSQESLKQSLSYDPETGLFTRLSCGGGVKPGTIAGSLRTDSYIAIRVNGVVRLAHILAWLYVHGRYPPLGFEIDHINRVNSDNRLVNLREVTLSENRRNRKCWTSSKLRGVSFSSTSRTDRAYIASISFNSKRYYLGQFPTAEEAHNAYNSKLAELQEEEAVQQKEKDKLNIELLQSREEKNA